MFQKHIVVFALLLGGMVMGCDCEDLVPTIPTPESPFFVLSATGGFLPNSTSEAEIVVTFNEPVANDVRQIASQLTIEKLETNGVPILSEDRTSFRITGFPFDCITNNNVFECNVVLTLNSFSDIVPIVNDLGVELDGDGDTIPGGTFNQVITFSL